MDNQNLNSVNQNNEENMNVQPNLTNNNVMPEAQVVEVLDDLMDTPSTNSFIKPPETNTQNPNELLSAVPKPDMMISSPTSNSVSTDDLLEEYIGVNYEKISKRNFNLPALFLGPTYFLYRKMYLYGVLLELIQLSLMVGLALVNPFISIVLALVSSILFCFLFNKIYISFSKSSIEKIKKTDKDKSINELSKICSKKGGTNIILAIVISSVISTVLMSCIKFVMPDIIEDITAKFIDAVSLDDVDNNGNETMEKDEKFENVFNGEINYKEEVLMEESINIGFLQIFKPTELNSSYRLDYEYESIPGNANSMCKLSLGVVQNYESSEKLIKEMANYYKVEDPITTDTSKNLSWHSIYSEGNIASVHYDTIENGTDVYLLTYEISQDANQNTCNAFYKGVLNSIEFK